MGFFGNNESTELGDMMDKGSKHLLACGLFMLKAFKPMFKGIRAHREQATLKAATQKMQQSLEQPGSQPQSPGSAITPVLARPNLTPPPRRKP